MQLTIDLTNQPAAYGKRIIAMIEAFYGLQSIDIKMDKGAVEVLVEAARINDADDQYRRDLQASRNAATVPSVPAPLPPAPSTAAAAPQPSVPVVTPASSPEPSVPPVPAAPTVPTAAAPTAPVTPSSPAGVEVDKDGLPWDARIHSGSKAINADGTWRKRKGLNDDALVARVQAELRAVMAVPPAIPASSPALEQPQYQILSETPEMAVVPFATTPPAMPPIPEAPAAPFVPPAPLPAAVFTPPPPPPAPVATQPAADPTTMPELMPRVTGAMAEGKIPPTAMLDACKAVGLPDLPSLAHRPDLIPQVWATLKASHPGVWV